MRDFFYAPACGRLKHELHELHELHEFTRIKIVCLAVKINWFLLIWIDENLFDKPLLSGLKDKVTYSSQILPNF